MLKLKLNASLSYLGIIVCIARLGYAPGYEILVALFLFLLNLNLRKWFKQHEIDDTKDLDVKFFQLNKKLMDLDDDVRKLTLAANFKGVVR